MPKVRIPNRFGQTPNELLNDSNLSLKAKGLYGFMQSKPDDWDFSIDGLESQLKEGSDAIRGAIKELEIVGWLTRINYKDEKGRWDCEYTLQIIRIENNKPLTSSKPYVEKPHTEKPHTEKPHTEKPHTENSVTEKPSYLVKQDLTKKEEKEEREQNTSSLSLNSKSFEITQNEVVEAKKEISKELITTKLGLDLEEMSEYKTIFDLYKFLNIKKQTTIEEFNQILDNPPKNFTNDKFSTMCWGGWINEIRSKNLQNKKEKELVQNQIGNKIKITMIDFINETSGLQGQELSNFEQNYYF